MKKKPPVEAQHAGLKVPPTTTMKLSDVNLAPYNPRVMPPDRMRALKASLLKHGMVLNLVIQKSSPKYGDLILIGGHQRVRAMREICKDRGWQEPEDVATVVLDVGDSEAKQLNVSLNNIEGEFDPYKLGLVFSEVRLDMSADDVLASGFAEDDISELIAAAASPEEQAKLLEDSVGELDGFGASITLSLEFSTVKLRDEAKELVREAAKARSKKGGDMVLGVLRTAELLRGGKKKVRAA